MRRSDERIWRYVDSGAASGAENMAEDERLLAAAADTCSLPVLRLYSWRPAAVSIGRFQDEARAVNGEACRRHGFDVVRRITGGGAVLHREELTYCISAPAGCDLFPPDVLGTYKVIAAGLLAGLHELGVPAEMALRADGNNRRTGGDAGESACFSSPSWYEIIVHGKKIIGSAQRRTTGAFLQHGSILIGYDPELDAAVISGGGKPGRVTCINHELKRAVSIEDIKQAVRKGFSKALHIEFS